MAQFLSPKTSRRRPADRNQYASWFFRWSRCPQLFDELRLDLPYRNYLSNPTPGSEYKTFAKRTARNFFLTEAFRRSNLALFHCLPKKAETMSLSHFVSSRLDHGVVLTRVYGTQCNCGDLVCCFIKTCFGQRCELLVRQIVQFHSFVERVFQKFVALLSKLTDNWCISSRFKGSYWGRTIFAGSKSLLTIDSFSFLCSRNFRD